ncbi:protein of unknown function [Pararobbsia alpina]
MQPLGELLQSRCVQVVDPLPASRDLGREASQAQYLQVLGNSGTVHVKRRSNFARHMRPLTEHLEDAPPRRVRERGEKVVISHAFTICRKFPTRQDYTELSPCR